MKKKVLGVLLAVAMCMGGLAGCGNSEEASAPKTEEPAAAEEPAGAEEPAVAEEPAEKTEGLEKLICSHHTSAHGLPSYIALKKGWFEEAGLDVELMIYTAGGPQMEALATDAWEIGTSGTPGAVIGMLNYDVKVIGMSIFDNPLNKIYAREDSALVAAGKGNNPASADIYGTKEDWEGLEVLLAKGTTQEMVLQATLETMGLTTDDVTVTNMDTASAFSAFKAGNGDAVAQWVTFCLNSESEGWVPVTTADAVGLDISNLIFATSNIIEQRPDVVQKWLNTYLKAAYWMAENPEEASEYFYDYCQKYGLNSSKEDCLNLLQLTKGAPSVDVQRTEWFSKDGEYSKVQQTIIGDLMTFFVNQDIYTEAEKETVMSDDCYETQFIENAVVE